MRNNIIFNPALRDEMPVTDPGFNNFQKRDTEHGNKKIFEDAREWQEWVEHERKKGSFNPVFSVAIKTMNRAQLKAVIFNTTGKMPAWYLPNWILRKRARGISG